MWASLKAGPPESLSVEVTQGYFSDLATGRGSNLHYGWSQFIPFGFLGGHSGIGPPSGAGTLGTAAHANVPTKPTNRINALSERFIVVLLGIAEVASNCPPSAVPNYTQVGKFLNP
jgi:hypothetical protein